MCIIGGGDSPDVPLSYPWHVRWRMRPSNEIHRTESLPRAIAALSFRDGELTDDAIGHMETFLLKRLEEGLFFFLSFFFWTLTQSDRRPNAEKKRTHGDTALNLRVLWIMADKMARAFDFGCAITVSKTRTK